MIAMMNSFFRRACFVLCATLVVTGCRLEVARDIPSELKAELEKNNSFLSQIGKYIISNEVESKKFKTFAFLDETEEFDFKNFFRKNNIDLTVKTGETSQSSYVLRFTSSGGEMIDSNGTRHIFKGRNINKYSSIIMVEISQNIEGKWESFLTFCEQLPEKRLGCINPHIVGSYLQSLIIKSNIKTALIYGTQPTTINKGDYTVFIGGNVVFSQIRDRSLIYKNSYEKFYELAAELIKSSKTPLSDTPAYIIIG